MNRFRRTRFHEPAKIMGLYPRKGQLVVGSDADVAILDPNRTWTVHHGDLNMSGDCSCWEGWELRGKIKKTILRGRELVEDEQWVGPKTAGQFVPRTLLPAIPSSSPDFSATFASSAQAATV